MSRESLTQFWKKIGSDAKLQKALEALFKRSSGRPITTGAAIVDLAAKHGFKFTADELRAHLAGIGREAELSEKDLEAVAGGFKVEIEGVTVPAVRSIVLDDKGNEPGLRSRTVLF